MIEGYCIKDALYRIATGADDALLKRLLRENTMPSWVTIATEREPSYFDAAALMGESYTLIAEEAQKRKSVIGMYACSYLPVHIDGRPECIGYFGGMRINNAFRHKLRYIRQGFDAIEKLIPKQSTVPFYFTSIASENGRARRLLEANVKGMPRYTPRGEITTMVFSVKQGVNSGVLQQAKPDDIPEIAAFYNRAASEYQLAPYLAEAWLEGLDGTTGLNVSDFWLIRDDDGVLQCSLALWDQRAFKQSVVQGYRRPLGHLRRLYNIYARLCKRVELPACGEALEHVYIAFFASKEKETAVKAVREAARIAEEKGATSCVMGLSSQHPFLAELKHRLKPSLYRTEIETVILEGSEAGIAGFDSRIVQPEVALL